jgi:hypothetical protein
MPPIAFDVIRAKGVLAFREMLFELTIEFDVRLELLLVRLLLCLLDEDLDVDLGGVESIVGSSLATIC